MIKQFYKPTSLEEALLLKEKYENAATWFAGGTHLNHADYKASYDKVISLEGLGLHYIKTRDNTTTVGASVTLQKLAGNGLIPDALRKAAFVGAPRSVRNMATIGGDIASRGRATRLLPCLIALNARIETAQKKSLTLEEYLQTDRSELILKVIIPLVKSCCCVNSYSLQSGGPILVNAAVNIPGPESEDETPIIAIGNMEESVRRLTDIEKMVQDNPTLDRDALESAIVETINPVEDYLGSVKFKKYITAITVSECILSCCLERG